MQLWTDVNDIAWGRVKEQKKERIMLWFDRLLDITRCRCALKSCEKVACPGNCKGGAHMVCQCPHDQKLPVVELGFCLAQRNKLGDRGDLQIGYVDKNETKKMS